MPALGLGKARQLAYDGLYFAWLNSFDGPKRRRVGPLKCLQGNPL